MRVAFLGTGIMGLPMARNVAEADIDVKAWNRTTEKAEPLRDAGAEVVAEPAEAVDGADLLVTMLSDSEAVLSVVDEALLEAAGAALWVQMGTIGLEGTERSAELALRAGIELVDAPVLGTKQPAEKGALTVIASGPEDARDRCAPLFDAVGQRTLWLGPAGEGTLMTFSPDPRKNPAAAEVVKRFKDKGIEPEGYVLYTYAAIQAWKQAAEKAKSTESAEVVKALNDTEFDTVIGKFKFNEKGDPNLPPYAVYRWSNGTYEEIGEEAAKPAG